MLWWASKRDRKASQLKPRGSSVVVFGIVLAYPYPTGHWVEERIKCCAFRLWATRLVTAERLVTLVESGAQFASRAMLDSGSIQ